MASPPGAPKGQANPDDLFTVQATAEALRRFMPEGSWMDHMAAICDGKAVGEAIRLTGPDLVYMRFPKNSTGRPMSFSMPKKYLIPVQCGTLALRSTGNTPTSASPSTFRGGTPSSRAGMVARNSHSRHEHVELDLKLGLALEPMMCVVCGEWDTDGTGKNRKSGHKCMQCIGKKSLPRLRQEFERLLRTEREALSGTPASVTPMSAVSAQHDF